MIVNPLVESSTRKGVLCVLALSTILLLATSSLAMAQSATPAAVVLEISGSSRPALAVREEIARGTQIVLAPEARLTLLHYSACTVVTIVGSAVSVTASGIDADPGSVQSRKQGPCPRTHLLSSEGARSSSGALVMRGTSPFLLLSPHIDAVLAGGRVLTVSSAEILDSEHHVVISTWSVDDTSIRSSEALASGKPYVLRLHLKSESVPLDVPFMVSKRSDLVSSILRFE